MKRKWIIWVSIILVILCFLSIVAGGVAYYFLVSRPKKAAVQAPVPVVEIFYPANLSEVPFGSIIPVGVEASMPEGNQIILLQLWVEGELIGDMTGSMAGLTASWGWVPSHDGETTLVGRAFNQEGGEGTSIIHVQVRRDLSDSDQDGVPDVEDDCPDVVGAPEWNGCTPEAAGAIGDAWAPVDESFSDEEGAELAGFEGEGLPEEELPPSEDPPVVEPDPDPPEPPEPDPLTVVEVEALSLVSAVGARDVYCYLTLTAQPVARVPDDAEGEFVEIGFPGEWNISEYMSGDRGRMVEVPETGPLHMEMDCWGHFSDDPLDPDVRHMGIVNVDHGPGDWDGHDLFARGEMDANWFDLTYRICQGSCEETILPAPYNLYIAFTGPNYEFFWDWDEDPAVDNSDVSFLLYRDGVGFVHVPTHDPHTVIELPPDAVEPPDCGQEYRWEVRAMRGGGIQFSNPSNAAWSVSPNPCIGENWLAIAFSFPFGDSSLGLALERFYTTSHSERVVVGAFPTSGGELVDETLFSWHGQTVGGGGGTSDAEIFYHGSELMTTDGLRLFMITVADGVFPGGDIIYERDVPFDFTWQPGVPDLVIPDIWYPEDDDTLRIHVLNIGQDVIEDWTPTFAFFQDVAGVRTRMVDLDSPPDLTPVTLEPHHGSLIEWPGWTPAQFALLQPIFEVEVDPDNMVAEFSEENNVYAASKPNIQITLQTIRIMAHGSSDAVGYSGCFVGLSGQIAVSTSTELFYFNGYGIKKNYPTAFDLYYPHELGLLVCPDQVFDVETELIPALMSDTCLSACSAYFAAHGQPIFAEAKHMMLPIPPWGTDYCSACYTLAGQTAVYDTTNVLSVPYAGGDLPIFIQFSNGDIFFDETSGFNPVCNFTGSIPAADMAALPITDYAITDPAGNCEIIVSVESFP